MSKPVLEFLQTGTSIFYAVKIKNILCIIFPLQILLRGRLKFICVPLIRTLGTVFLNQYIIQTEPLDFSMSTTLSTRRRVVDIDDISLSDT